MKLVVTEFLTLDGVMQAPGGSDEDPSGGFEHGGWQMQLMDEAVGEVIMKGIGSTDGLLLGRVTYEIFAGYWPTAPAEENAIADPFNKMPKWVVSSTLEEPLDWENSHLINHDVAAEVSKLKEQDGRDLQVIGSGVLVQELMRAGLVDEFSLIIYPLVLGKGKRLFKEGLDRSALRLADSQISPGGVLILSYEPAEA